MLKQRHNLFVGLFGVLDTAAISASAMIAWSVTLQRFDQPMPVRWEDIFKDSLVVFAVPIAMVTMVSFQLYKPRRDKALVKELGQVFKASLISVMMIVVALWAVGSSKLNTIGPPPEQFPGWRLATDPFRFQLAILAVSMPISIGTCRAFVRLALRFMRRRGWNMRHVAIIGVGRLGQITARTLTRNSWTGIRVSYFVSHHEQTARAKCLTHEIAGGVSQLESILDSRRVDAVYLAIPSAMSAQLPQILRRLERFAVDVRIVPDVHPRYLPQNMVVSELEGMPILSYRESPMAGVGGFLKRILDIFGALVGLILFSPIMFALAIAIRRSSPGPVIFKQRRVSLGGDTFEIWKFRTMTQMDQEQGSQESEAGATWTSKDDPRVTRFGAWLRKTSLDELPQFFNVLRGDMALVGPRPERPELIDRFREDWRGYMLRQQVKAGMTGWAQVNGLRGDTSLRKRLQYDLFYIRNWSVWFDIRILTMTIYRGFIHKNAY